MLKFKKGVSKAIYGNITGLKKSEVKAVERLYRRKVAGHRLITPELARYMTGLSSEIGRQIGVLVTRDGFISHVIVGDAKGIFIPELTDFPLGRRPLRGIRLLHTHLKDEPLNQDDLADLALLRFDIIMAIGMRDGSPSTAYIAHLTAGNADMAYDVQPPIPFYQLDINFKEFIDSLEHDIDKANAATISLKDRWERAILISASTRPRVEQEDSIEELKELAISSDVLVLDTVIQRLKDVNPRYLLGEGKLKEIIIKALQKGATLLIFDQDLNPSQIKAIGDITELKVIDRSQLILDIFARRAHSRDGKVQVELAQLKYRLPRLTGKGTAMSRLMGGIGGRGPGEMKLEVDRRRVRDRIALLERELKALSLARHQRKQRRTERDIPIVSIIGYTNAGKSTLLNNLTKSSTFVEEKMFATLDTASRRLRFPRERDVIITDTVGFIRDLPRDLFAAFKSTLEELEDADLLVHLVDISNPRFEQHIASVERILQELGLADKERIMVFNKEDRLKEEEADTICRRFGATSISALRSETFDRLLKAIEGRLWDKTEKEMVDV